MSDKKIKTLAVISFGISAILIYILLKMKKKSASVPDIPSTSYNKDLYKNYLITVPSDKSSVNVVIVYGGIDYATPSWMLNQIPEEILLRNLVFLSPYTNDSAQVKNDLQSYLNSKNLTQKSLSVVGFSAGGNNAQYSYSNDLRFFGLIDPSTKSAFLNLNFDSNSYMVYNDNNWGAYPSIQSLQPKIASKIENGGGVVEKVSLTHSKIPQYFFSTYSSLI